MEDCVGDFKEECYEDSHTERMRFQPPKSNGYNPGGVKFE